VTENITKGVRELSYRGILSKDIGWFDDEDNSSGQLTHTLASETAQINGAGAEGISVAFNSCSALITGITIAFYFSWRLALVALGCVPFMIIGSMIDMQV